MRSDSAFPTVDAYPEVPLPRRSGAEQFLQAARIDACSFANNHTLDFEARGLSDTQHTLGAAGIRYAPFSYEPSATG